MIQDNNLKSTVMLNKLTGKPRLLVYQNNESVYTRTNTRGLIIENDEFVFKNTSPSKMTDEEKVHYHSKLLRESDEIADKITLQINQCEEVRATMREQIKESQDLIDSYKTEHEQFKQRIEYRKSVYGNSSFQYQELAARN